MQEFITFISNHPVLASLTLAVFILLMIIEFLRNKRNLSKLSPAQAVQKINHDNAIVIDIRPEDAYRAAHILDAKSIPAAELKTNVKKLEKFKNKPLIIICNTGMEAQKIAALLIKQGYNALVLAGGMRAWIQAELPIVKEKN